MAKIEQRQIIDVLDCDLAVRPKAAPGLHELSAHVKRISRGATELVIEVDPAGAEILSAIVEAERTCCPGIGWEIEEGDRLTLRITGGQEQVSMLETLIT